MESDLPSSASPDIIRLTYGVPLLLLDLTLRGNRRPRTMGLFYSSLFFLFLLLQETNQNYTQSTQKFVPHRDNISYVYTRL
jgi:hypothetical protein